VQSIQQESVIQSVEAGQAGRQPLQIKLVQWLTPCTSLIYCLYKAVLVMSQPRLIADFEMENAHVLRYYNH
jgi:hypothetical protein